MQGQATHFRLYAPEKLDYPIFRYINECKRLYRILDEHLSSKTSGYLVGDRCTIADLAHYGWIACAGWSGLNIEEFPHLRGWLEKMESRPAIQRAKHIPDPWGFQDLPKSQKATDDFTKPGREWFIKLIAEDVKHYSL